MGEAIKQVKGSGISHEERIDLSAGFVPKSRSSAGEPPVDKMTPDSFMTRQAPVAIEGSEAGLIDEKSVSWRWCTEADMPALQRLNFDAEIASSEPIYLPKAASNLRIIAVAERDGKVLGGIQVEDSIVVSLIGQDPSVMESAGEWMTQIIVAQARKERTRFLQSSVPARLVARLDDALQKVGFKPLMGTSYRLDTGIEADEKSSTRRN
jgi:hypothetical protein